MKNRVKSLLLAFCIAAAVVPGFAAHGTYAFAAQSQTDTATRDENLVKLAKVWGFTKYTHNSFISGQKCWDEELLALIPIIYHADSADVNSILYDWFVGLGEDGFDLKRGHDFDWAGFFAARGVTLAELEALDEATREERGLVDLIIEYRKYYEFFTAKLEDGYDLYWETFYRLMQEMFPAVFWGTMRSHAMAFNMDLRQMADLSWINEEYIGSLAALLLRFDGISASDLSAAPVFLNNWGLLNFSNQRSHAQMDYSDKGYRLLGLFRLWNAMKYYFPHLDILDVAWNDLLIEFIPMMLEGTDRYSYEATLAAMAHYLQDAHVSFAGTSFFIDMFGRYTAPVQLIAAEGRLVVYETFGFGNPLERGDVILGLNGRDIDEITEEMRRFLPYPNDERALTYIAGRAGGWHHALRSHTRNMEVDILRRGVPMAIDVVGTISMGRSAPSDPRSHAFLGNNIGLINPSISGDVHHIMEVFAATDGIIIDLRQRPRSYSFIEDMAQYLLDERQVFFLISRPSPTHPGVRTWGWPRYAGGANGELLYDRPVVLLMDERTFSYPETVVMALRNGPNVVVIGPYSMGSNGDVVRLPLPGGISMSFTSLGVYTPEGGQTHRIGLTPDIHVERTIQGIAEGRNEQMEAAIRHILGE